MNKYWVGFFIAVILIGAYLVRGCSRVSTTPATITSTTTTSSTIPITVPTTTITSTTTPTTVPTTITTSTTSTSSTTVPVTTTTTSTTPTTLPVTTTTSTTNTTIIYKSGKDTICGTCLYDFDEGVLNPEDSLTRDIWWRIHSDPPLDATLERRNNALIYNAGIIDFDTITYEDISTAPLTSEGISHTELAENSVVYVQTTEGRYTKFKIASLGYNLEIQWVTYE